MQSEFIIHDDSALRLQQFIERPSHALLLVGPVGIGKGSVARQLAAHIVDKPLAAIAEHPYIRIVKMDEKTRSISIDTIRQLEHFLSLKVPGNTPRIIIIEDAHGLTIEAQNALLKTLEEPHANTILLLTAAGEQSLLPTIRSRVASLTLRKPAAEKLQKYFEQQGHTAAAIRQTHLMSSGLPGLMSALLRQETDHPLVQAVATARAVIQMTQFERLTMVDKLSKDREHCQNMLTMMQQMAHLSLAAGKTAQTWQRILKQSYQATDLLATSAQPKLVLTNLMLNL